MNTFRSSELTARYDLSLGKLDASVFAGMSQEYNHYDRDYYRKYDLVDSSLTGIDAGTTNGRSPERTMNGPCVLFSVA